MFFVMRRDKKVQNGFCVWEGGRKKKGKGKKGLAPGDKKKPKIFYFGLAMLN